MVADWLVNETLPTGLTTMTLQGYKVGVSTTCQIQALLTYGTQWYYQLRVG